MNIAIVGAGIFGRLLAYTLSRHGQTVHVFSQDTIDMCLGASRLAAGMLAPTSEQADLAKSWYQPARASLDLWPMILASLPEAIAFVQTGTWMVALKSHEALLMHYLKRLPQHQVQYTDTVPFDSCCGAFIQQEAYLDAGEVLRVLAQASLQYGATWHELQTVTQISQHQITTQTNQYDFDVIVDCRGLGTTAALGLRGLQGELITLQTAITLPSMIRFIHPRQSIYMVPRKGAQVLVGGTQLERAVTTSPSVWSMLSLLQALVQIDPEFHHAQLIACESALRPTALNHQPILRCIEGVWYLNGAYRHGFLLAPILVAQLVRSLLNEPAFYYCEWKDTSICNAAHVV